MNPASFATKLTRFPTQKWGYQIMRHKQTAADNADLSIGGAGPPDEACIVSKGSGIYTHLHIIELGVEQHKGVRSVKKA